jgi:hypothetical protein
VGFPNIHAHPHLPQTVPASFRFLLRAACALGSTLAIARGQGTPAPTPPPALPPELAAMLAALPVWSTIASVHAGLGYKDNVLLSHAGAEGSGFARGGVETLLSHVRLGSSVDYAFGLNAEGTRYFSSTTVNHEDYAIAQAEWRYRLGEVFKFSLDLQGYYLDQIFDVSDTDAQRVVAQLKLSGATVGPTLRWTFRPWGWIEVQGTGKRDTYRDGANNNHLGDGAARLGWRPGKRFEASIAAMERSRDFDQRSQFSVSGRALFGTHLKILEREREARCDVTWDAAARWKTTTRAGTLDYTDNGSGYFNYRQRKIGQELDWTPGDWLVHLEGTARQLEFQVQTVGLGLAPPARVKEEFSAQFRIERKLNARWTLYAEYNWERSRCNDPIASYNMNEGLLGARWSWDK